MMFIEPDIYLKYNKVITGKQGADGFRKLHSILKSKEYPVNLVVGPDVATLSLLNYLKE